MYYDFFILSQNLKAANEILDARVPQVETFMKQKAVPLTVAGMMTVNVLANCLLNERPLHDAAYLTLPVTASIPYEKPPISRIPGLWNMLISANTSSTTTAITHISGDYPPSNIPAIHKESLPVSYHAVPITHCEHFVNGDRMEIIWI